MDFPRVTDAMPYCSMSKSPNTAYITKINSSKYLTNKSRKVLDLRWSAPQALLQTPVYNLH